MNWEHAGCKIEVKQDGRFWITEATEGLGGMAAVYSSLTEAQVAIDKEIKARTPKSKPLSIPALHQPSEYEPKLEDVTITAIHRQNRDLILKGTRTGRSAHVFADKQDVRRIISALYCTGKWKSKLQDALRPYTIALRHGYSSDGIWDEAEYARAVGKLNEIVQKAQASNLAPAVELILHALEGATADEHREDD